MVTFRALLNVPMRTKIASKVVKRNLVLRVDGSAVTTTFWALGEPNNLNSENCAGFDFAGEWNDSSCSKLHPYICSFGEL